MAAGIVLCALLCIAFCTAVPEIIPAMDIPLVAEFDGTCTHVSPPEIKNGKASVEHRQDGQNTFLMAIYSCIEDYELEIVGNIAMYCSKGKWIGYVPKCIQMNFGNYDELDDEYSDDVDNMNNCAVNNGGCSQICNESTNECECVAGYALNTTDLRTCKDIDECKESNGGCSQVCNNLPGEFICTCTTGYEIDKSDEKTCLDIDECANSDLSWDCTAGCENLIGSYKCLPSMIGKVVPADGNNDSTVGVLCKSGFQLSTDGSECQDINECDLVDKNPKTGRETHRYCKHKCENTIGSYICHCPEGYHLLEDHHSCAWDGSNSITTSKVSPTLKKCQSGFELSADGGKCQDINECELKDPKNPEKLLLCDQKCKNVIGSFRCYCSEGFQLQKDLRSCALEECDPGLERSADGKGCQDIDECTKGLHKCSDICHNTRGGYRCSCPKGLKLINNTTCVDPCEDNNNGCEQICLRSSGGTCSCRQGFQLSADHKSCNDVNECLISNGGCQQVCRNLQGSHVCACKLGFRLNKDEKSCQKTPIKPPLEIHSKNPWWTLQPWRSHDLCPQFRAPQNGNAHCKRYLQNGFYNTHCSITCNPGYELQGPQSRSCDRTGIWDGPETKCVAIHRQYKSNAVLCPTLKPPSHGFIFPQSCTEGPSEIGRICQLICNAGYVPIGDLQTYCTIMWGWIFKSELNCQPHGPNLYSNQFNSPQWNAPQNLYRQLDFP